MLHARFNSAAAACLFPALLLDPFVALIFRVFSVPAPSKLAIPAAASIQISLSNLAAVGSPLYDPPPPPPSSLALAAWPIVRHQVFRSYVGFKRDASHTAQPPMGVWELDGWWRSPEQASSDAGSIKATVAIIIVCSCVVAAVIYRCVSILFFHFHRHLLKATHFDLSFSHHVTTPAPQLLFRLNWTRTPRPVEDDDGAHGSPPARVFFALLSPVVPSATFSRGICTSALSARSVSVRNASRYLAEKTKLRNRAALWTWTRSWTSERMTTKRLRGEAQAPNDFLSLT